MELTVVKVDGKRGFAFADSTTDSHIRGVFIHASSYVGNFNLLMVGDTVECEISRGVKGYKADTASRVGGDPERQKPDLPSDPFAVLGEFLYDPGTDSFDRAVVAALHNLDNRLKALASN